MDTATKSNTEQQQTPSYQTISNAIENWDGQKVTSEFREAIYALSRVLKETNVRQCLEQALQHPTGQSRSTAASGSSGSSGSSGGLGLGR